MSRKELIIAFGFAAASFALATLSGAVSWTLQFVITGLTYFAAALTLSRRRVLSDHKGIVALIVLIPYIAIYGGVSISAHSLQTYPIWIVGILGYALGTLVGTRLQRQRNLIIVTVVYAATIIPGGATFMHYWLSYVFQPVNSQINRAIDFKLSTLDGTRVTSNDLKGRVVVLKFWATSCAACIREFPTFDLLYRKHQEDADVAIYSVNIPLDDETPSQIAQYTSKYTFPVLLADSDIRTVMTQFGIQGVPTIVVLNKSSVVRYSGPLALGSHSFVDDISRLIGQLRQELTTPQSTSHNPRRSQ